MPDERRHRGPHPEDERLFARSSWPALTQATADLSWLLSRGYAHESSLKLVGDRYRLAARQRLAVARCACGDSERAERRRRQVGPMELPDCPLWLDGYNVLTTIEAALSGGVILAARDGTYRDMASMHGSYRKVAETLPALELLAATIAALGAVECVWYLDRPVSNSGRLKELIEDPGRRPRLDVARRTRCRPGQRLDRRRRGAPARGHHRQRRQRRAGPVRAVVQPGPRCGDPRSPCAIGGHLRRRLLRSVFLTWTSRKPSMSTAAWHCSRTMYPKSGS